jgi:hypothetical protein
VLFVPSQQTMICRLPSSLSIETLLLDRLVANLKTFLSILVQEML